MSEELVVEQCSPTMAGLKTGNLFSCPAEDTRTLWQSIRRLNQRLVPCGIRLVPVKSLGDREPGKAAAGPAGAGGTRHSEGKALPHRRPRALCGGAGAPPEQGKGFSA